jgi:hypothetical protein
MRSLSGGGAMPEAILDASQTSLLIDPVAAGENG